MDDIVLDYSYVASLIDRMQEMSGQSTELKNYAMTHVCSSKGFGGEMCLLNPLSGSMTALAEVFDQAFLDFYGRWRDVQTALANATVELKGRDESSAEDFANLMNLIYRDPSKQRIRGMDEIQ